MGEGARPPWRGLLRAGQPDRSHVKVGGRPRVCMGAPPTPSRRTRWGPPRRLTRGGGGGRPKGRLEQCAPPGWRHAALAAAGRPRGPASPGPTHRRGRGHVALPPKRNGGRPYFLDIRRGAEDGAPAPAPLRAKVVGERRGRTSWGGGPERSRRR